jgi:hypothetical protein
MPPVTFEPTIPKFERAKIFHALDRAATVTGIIWTLVTDKQPVEAILVASSCGYPTAVVPTIAVRP